MFKVLGCLLSTVPFLVFSLHVASAAPIIVERRVTTSDDKNPEIPVSAAKVLLRTFDLQQGTLLQEKHVVTDQKGLFHTEMEGFQMPTPQGNPGVVPQSPKGGYLMIDSPGKVLTFSKFLDGAVQTASQWMFAGQGFQIHGKIVDTQGTPVQGAQVMLVGLRDDDGRVWPFNSPDSKISTPELVVESGKDGTFSLRHICFFGTGDSIYRFSNAERGTLFTPLLVARKSMADTHWASYKELPPRSLAYNGISFSSDQEYVMLQLSTAPEMILQAYGPPGA